MKMIWSHSNKELFFSVQFADVSSSCHEILPGPWLLLLQLMTLQPVWRWRTVSERFSAMLRRSAPNFISNKCHDLMSHVSHLHHKFVFGFSLHSDQQGSAQQNRTKRTTFHSKYSKINNWCIFRNRKMRKDLISLINNYKYSLLSIYLYIILFIKVSWKNNHCFHNIDNSQKHFLSSKSEF